MPSRPAGIPSQAVLDARARRSAVQAARDVRIKWFIDDVVNKVDLGSRQRMVVAVNLLRDRIVQNISKPVDRRGGRITIRSKPGEFPRADTTQLMKTIFSGVKRGGKRGTWDGIVGTPLDYGVILELRLNRSFLVRTLNESRPFLKSILTRPIK